MENKFIHISGRECILKLSESTPIESILASLLSIWNLQSVPHILLSASGIWIRATGGLVVNNYLTQFTEGPVCVFPQPSSKTPTPPLDVYDNEQSFLSSIEADEKRIPDLPDLITASYSHLNSYDTIRTLYEQELQRGRSFARLSSQLALHSSQSLQSIRNMIITHTSVSKNLTGHFGRFQSENERLLQTVSTIINQSGPVFDSLQKDIKQLSLISLHPLTKTNEYQQTLADVIPISEYQKKAESFVSKFREFKAKFSPHEAALTAVDAEVSAVLKGLMDQFSAEFMAKIDDLERSIAQNVDISALEAMVETLEADVKRIPSSSSSSSSSGPAPAEAAQLEAFRFKANAHASIMSKLESCYTFLRKELLPSVSKMRTEVSAILQRDLIQIQATQTSLRKLVEKDQVWLDIIHKHERDWGITSSSFSSATSPVSGGGAAAAPSSSSSSSNLVMLVHELPAFYYNALHEWLRRTQFEQSRNAKLTAVSSELEQLIADENAARKAFVDKYKHLSPFLSTLTLSNMLSEFAPSIRLRIPPPPVSPQGTPFSSLSSEKEIESLFSLHPDFAGSSSSSSYSVSSGSSASSSPDSDLLLQISVVSNNLRNTPALECDMGMVMDAKNKEIEKLKQDLKKTREKCDDAENEIVELKKQVNHQMESIHMNYNEEKVSLDSKYKQELEAEKQRATAHLEEERKKAVSELEEAKNRAALELEQERKRAALELEQERKRASRELEASNKTAADMFELEKRAGNEKLMHAEETHRALLRAQQDRDALQSRTIIMDQLRSKDQEMHAAIEAEKKKFEELQQNTEKEMKKMQEQRTVFEKEKRKMEEELKTQVQRVKAEMETMIQMQEKNDKEQQAKLAALSSEIKFKEAAIQSAIKEKDAAVQCRDDVLKQLEESASQLTVIQLQFSDAITPLLNLISPSSASSVVDITTIQKHATDCIGLLKATLKPVPELDTLVSFLLDPTSPPSPSPSASASASSPLLSLESLRSSLQLIPQALEAARDQADVNQKLHETMHDLHVQLESVIARMNAQKEMINQQEITIASLEKERTHLQSEKRITSENAAAVMNLLNSFSRELHVPCQAELDRMKTKIEQSLVYPERDLLPLLSRVREIGSFMETCHTLFTAMGALIDAPNFMHSFELFLNSQLNEIPKADTQELIHSVERILKRNAELQAQQAASKSASRPEVEQVALHLVQEGDKCVFMRDSHGEFKCLTFGMLGSSGGARGSGTGSAGGSPSSVPYFLSPESLASLSAEQRKAHFLFGEIIELSQHTATQPASALLHFLPTGSRFFDVTAMITLHEP